MLIQAFVPELAVETLDVDQCGRLGCNPCAVDPLIAARWVALADAQRLVLKHYADIVRTSNSAAHERPSDADQTAEIEVVPALRWGKTAQ